jgi:hypothetical protein
MDEFGRQTTAGIAEKDEEPDPDSVKMQRPNTHDSMNLPTHTPAPPPQHRTAQAVPTLSLNGAAMVEGHQREEEDEKGCCKCIIM